MPLLVLRLVFLIVAAGLGVQLAQSEILPKDPPFLPAIAFFGVVMLAIGVIVIDIVVTQKKLDVITAVYFGLIIGLFLTYITKLALTPVLSTAEPVVALYLPSLVGMALCYACISVLIQTRNDFRFIIPYVEFAKQIKGLKPLVLDTSVVIDGRIADVVETGVVDSQLIMPQFVISELQGIADSSDKLRRNRGRRGLDILNRLRSNQHIDLVIFDRELPEFEGQAVDQKLVLLAKHLEGKVVTNDYNLNKVAKLQSVGVVNLNDIANALKPVFLP
ncbi:MAG: PIN domain-containing protein, partial [Planctomycetota bacterium]